MSRVIYSIPLLDQRDHAVLALIDQHRQQLRHHVAQAPTRWQGSLRRTTLARALRGSNSIEGYDANLDQAALIVDDERPDTLEDETYRALAGYRSAMTYILRMHDDPYFRVDAQVIRSIHFMMLNYDLTKMPGQWRPGHVFVVQEASGERVYEGPDAEQVPALMELLVQQLSDSGTDSPLVRGAMAHLNLVMVHPFKDGNGRMACALQTLVIARGGILNPVFSSIEEWLGRNTMAYYDILVRTGQGRWNPANDALPWVRFCLRAHYQQGATLLRRNRELGAVWEEVERLIARLSLPSRSDSVLVDAAFGFTVRNSRYRQEAEVSDAVASRDLRRLCEAGLLVAVGDKRGRFYVASEVLRAIRQRAAEPRRVSDPYELVDAEQLPLFDSPL